MRWSWSHQLCSHVDVWAGAYFLIMVHLVTSFSRTLIFPLAALIYGSCAGLTVSNWYVKSFMHLETLVAFPPSGKRMALYQCIIPCCADVPHQTWSAWGMSSLPFHLVSFDPISCLGDCSQGIASPPQFSVPGVLHSWTMLVCLTICWIWDSCYIFFRTWKSCLTFLLMTLMST